MAGVGRGVGGRGGQILCLASYWKARRSQKVQLSGAVGQAAVREKGDQVFAVGRILEAQVGAV
jgi:hypothetical protein